PYGRGGLERDRDPHRGARARRALVAHFPRPLLDDGGQLAHRPDGAWRRRGRSGRASRSACRSGRASRASVRCDVAPRRHGSPEPGTSDPGRGRAARAEPKPPAPRPFTVRVGASAWFAQGGASPLGSAAVGGSWFFHRRLCAEADLRIPVLFANVHGPEGTATLAVSTLAAGLSFALTPITAAVRPAIGAGLALAWTRAQGTAIAPFVSARADVFSAVPFVRLSTGLALAESV